jgi:hypothetical protein
VKPCYYKFIKYDYYQNCFRVSLHTLSVKMHKTKIWKISKVYKNTNHQQTHEESFIINRNTLLHVSTLLGHLQGELFFIVTLMLHFIVERECAVGLQAGTAESSRPQKPRSTQSTAHSHSTIKCNLSVTITESSPWRWPSRVETCRSVLRLMIKLSLYICWWLVFLYNILYGY